MRPFLSILTAMALMMLAFWAYRENYATQRAIRDVSGLQQEITDLREALALQKAEWAYLNRPDRLRDLALLNFDALRLLPLEPAQFGRVDQVVYPRPPLLEPEITNPIDTIGTIDGEEVDPL